MMKYILIIVFMSLLLSDIEVGLTGPISQYVSDQEYITGEDGIIRMYVNILGHVNNPGTYLVYDGIDFISLLALAGGPARGSDLKAIKIIQNKKSYEINFKNFLKTGEFDSIIEISPRTTIYIEEKPISKMFRGTNLVSSILQVLTLAVTIENVNRTSNND